MEQRMELKVPPLNPWKRGSDVRATYVRKEHHFGQFQESIEKNVGLDWPTKSAALNASPSVVALISYTGIHELFKCSGTIVTSNATDDGRFLSTILTSATLLRCHTRESAVADNIKVDVYSADGHLYEGIIVGHNFNFNVAVIAVDSPTALTVATIANVDDLTNSMTLIALGRYHRHPYNIMAASGSLRLVDSGLDCEELLMSDCEITKNGIGGPIINCNRLVVGMSFYKGPGTPFLPINIALKCLELLQNNRKIPRPWLGVKLSDTHTADFGELEKLNQTFPKLLEGIVVKQIESESPASHGGLRISDVIFHPVKRTLEFQSLMLEEANKPVQVIVKRPGNLEFLRLTLRSRKARKVNRWPLPKQKSYQPVH